MVLMIKQIMPLYPYCGYISKSLPQKLQRLSCGWRPLRCYNQLRKNAFPVIKPTSGQGIGGCGPSHLNITCSSHITNRIGHMTHMPNRMTQFRTVVVTGKKYKMRKLYRNSILWYFQYCSVLFGVFICCCLLFRIVVTSLVNLQCYRAKKCGLNHQNRFFQFWRVNENGHANLLRKGDHSLYWELGALPKG